MPKTDASKALKELITPATIDALRDINQLHVCKHAGDAASAIRSGAILLGISSVKNDNDGDGFRYLIGLKRHTKWVAHLSCFFNESINAGFDPA